MQASHITKESVRGIGWKRLSIEINTARNWHPTDWRMGAFQLEGI
jgi:hypothetical protein